MPAASRFAYLDGLRALAIGGVLATHYVDPFLPLGRAGIMGVDVFFVLSGFIITTVLWRSAAGPVAPAYRSFLWRRVRRLYPALLGLLVVGTLLIAVVPHSTPPASEAVRSAVVAALQGTWILEGQGQAVEPFRLTWSLGIEWCFYLVWPVALLVLRARGTAPLRLARGAALTGLVMYAGSLWLPGVAFYFSPVPRFGEMLAGAALALVLVDPPAWARPRSVRTWPATLVLGALCAYIALAPFETHATETRLVSIPFAVLATVYLVWWGYSSGTGPAYRLLTLAPVTFVGRISYSLYLWHTIPAYLLDKDLIDLPYAVLGVAGLAMTATLTALSHVLLERPFLRSRSDVLRPDRSRTGAGSGTGPSTTAAAG